MYNPLIFILFLEFNSKESQSEKAPAFPDSTHNKQYIEIVSKVQRLLLVLFFHLQFRCELNFSSRIEYKHKATSEIIIIITRINYFL